MKNLLQSMIRSLKPALYLCALGLWFLRPSGAQALEVHFEEDRAVPTVHLTLAFRNGAAADPADRRGLGHFLLEMLTRGTTSRSKSSFDLEVDTLGANIDTEIRSEFSLIRASVLTSQLPKFLRLLEDMILNPKFQESEIRKLRAETLSLLAEEKGRDGTIAGKLFTEFLFTGPDGKVHPYGWHLAGRAQEIEKINRADLLRHHQDLLTADRLVVIGSGDLDTKSITAWAEKLASKLPQKSRLRAEVPPPPQHGRPRLLVVHKPDRTQGVVVAGQPGILLGSPEYAALSVANQAFGGSGFNSRLMTEIRVKRGWSYGAYSHFKYGLKPRSWSLSFQPATKDLAPSVAYLGSLLKEVRQKGLTREEFDVAKQSLIAGSGFLYNTPAKRMENTILERMLHLKDGFFKNYASMIEGLPHEEVNAAFQQFVDPSRMSFLVLTTSTPELEKSLGQSLEVAPGDMRSRDYRAD
jgi:zinc protease